MTNTLLQNAELLKQNRDTVFRRGAARAQKGPIVSVPAVGIVLAGDRVFDPVSGEEGEVIHVSRENVVVPTTK